MHYLIIGNSIASVGCIEAIRKLDTTNPITVVGEESHPCYARPLISYLLEKRTDEEKMVYRPTKFYETNQVTLITGKTVIHVDAQAKQAVLDDGTSLPYDKLLLATGSKPFIPPMKGLDTVKQQFTFLTLDAAKALDAAIQTESRVLIVGAGLIGLKCAEGLLRRVQSVTVVDLADRILSSILDEQAARMVQAHLQAQGIRFHLKESVAEFIGNEALLQSGIALGFDILVLAIGVRPAITLATQIGLRTNKGILIDQACRTSKEDIWAAGDCSEGWELVSREQRILALLPNAYLQGETAGNTMANGSARFENAIAMNAIGFFGLHVITAGIYSGEKTVVPTPNGYKCLFVQGNRLVGYILVGSAIERAGIYTALIRNQTDLATLDFAMISEKPALMAFAQSVRVQTLGGVQ